VSWTQLDEEGKRLNKLAGCKLTKQWVTD